MKIAIVTTGDEILAGIIVDTNTAWISERCRLLGHAVVRHISAPDDTEEIGEALKSASSLADCVIVSGGLGPTIDDITVDAASRAFGVKLILDESCLNEIRDFFRRQGRHVAKSNEKQAMIPEGGRPLKNRVGTAPGIQVKFEKSEFFFLPGVPKELYQIFEDHVMPWLHKNSKGSYESRVLRCFGMAEAAIDDALKGIDLSQVRLSFRVKYPEVLLKLEALEAGSKDAKKRISQIADEIKARLKDTVYGEGEEGMAKVVGGLLHDLKMTISVAESCTGGLISNMITDVTGSSEYFERGIVCYSNRSKQEMLGVSLDLLRAHGAVSRETAMAMAEGVKRLCGSTIGIGVTGIAGPGGGAPEKPVGTVHIAHSSPSGTEAFVYNFNGSREMLKLMFAVTALNMVRKYLLNTRAL